MSWIDVANQLDNSIFRFALSNAVSDMCFYEGITEDVEQYISTIEKGENTVELDKTIMDRLIPHLEHAILTYGIYLNEGEIKAGGGQFVTGASAMKAKQASGVVPAELSGLHPTVKKQITESADMTVAGKKTGVALTKTGAGPHNNIEMNDEGNIGPEVFKGEGDYEFALKHGIADAKAKTQPLTGNTDIGKVTHAGIVHKKKVHSEMLKAQPKKGSEKEKYTPNVVKEKETPSS